MNINNIGSPLYVLYACLEIIHISLHSSVFIRLVLKPFEHRRIEKKMFVPQYTTAMALWRALSRFLNVNVTIRQIYVLIYKQRIHGTEVEQNYTGVIKYQR